MLKHLAILAVAIPFATVGVLASHNAQIRTPEEGIAKASRGQNGSGQRKPHDSNQSATNALPTAHQPPTPTCNEACQQARQNLKIQRKLAIFTGLLVFVGFLQVGTMIWQAWLLHGTWKTIERQTKSFINKERSRLFLTCEITPEFKIAIGAVNRGQSPARITYKFVGCEILDEGEGLPDIPRYTEWGEPADDYASDEWAVPKRPIRVGRYDASYIIDPKNPELNESVLSGKCVVWFYGIVVYQDSVSEDEHSIKFCYRCSLSENGKIWLSDDGPPAYRGEA
jgi:hypothetical protein